MRMFFTGTAPGGSGDKMVDVGSGFGLPQEEESRIKDAVGDVNNAPGSTVQVHGGLQKPQQKLQGLVAWERFLPVRSLKVLLVENDDSTRHVVSALLRNCSYEVTSVANGLQAWNILEDLTNHFDIILTEVVMPFVTGIGLLCKIMNHKTLKNIPVIMMSSHDSMGIVFKCLSKGAVDFLVKPIRKNELKNLWQHVWRRCHSSSGSGSESGTQTKRSAVSKSNESANNNGSNDERDNGSPGLSVQDGSDNGSGTQSSRTKKVVEIDSPQPISQWDQLADDSTCAQTMHIKPERISDSWLHIATTKKHPEENEKQDHVAMGKDLEIGMSRNAYLSLESQGEKFSIDSRSTEQSKLPDPESTAVGEEQFKHHTEDASDKMSTRTAYLMTSDVNCTTLLHSKSAEPPIGFTENSQHKDKVSCDSRNLPSRRLRGVAEGIVTQNERNVLRHSDLSAFSKYNNASSSNQGPTGNVGSCSPLGNSSDAIKTDTMENFASKSNITPVLHSNGSSNINNVANTKHATPKPECLNDKSEPVSAFRYFPDSTDEPVQDDSICHHQVIPGKADDLEVNTVHTEKRGSHLHVQVQHHHHHYHHYHHHVHNLQQKQQQQQHQQTDPEDCSLKKMCADAPQCGSSNVFGGLVEAVNVKLRADTPQRTVNVFAEENAGNYSVNGSASGSNYGSNGQNGSSIALNAGVTNMESDNGMTRNPGSHDTDGKAGGNGGEEDRCAQREAALTKFRQKRKGRCFEKKVRYQSRKRLAEQRPRVRGQFVRQTICDDKADKDVQSCCLESGDDSCDR